MIKTFTHKGLKHFYELESKAGISPSHVTKLKDILASLDAAVVVNDMDAPGYGLHPLKGNLKGYWAVSVSGAWRIIFRMEGENVFDVDYLQYH